ncbi:3-deoxy-D-manno-octulosonic acid transferase [bacterium]|nr:3-deoxy-D-manno-octulosonic acid transferase [bacterium]
MNHFDLAYLAALPVLAPVVTYKRMRYGKYRESLPGMLGKRLPSPPFSPAGVERCWLHSVSVGETIAAGSIYKSLRHRELGWDFLATTTTETGQAQAKRTLEGAEAFAYAPADFSWTVRAFLDAYNPSLYCLFETEIWPNLLSQCGQRGIPVYLINGKVSDRSAERYARARALFRGPLSSIHRFFMQTEKDAERMARILGSDELVRVFGNVKFDALPTPLTVDERADIRGRWGAGEDTIVILAGSTHPGEEEIVLEAYRRARLTNPNALLVLAPRHPERFSPVAELLTRADMRVHRTSTGPNPGDADVVLLDEMGVLARSFGAAEIALVAGSWCPVGGHNLLEAGVHGIPVLRGPDMHSQPDIVRVLGPEQGAPEVSAEDLGDWLIRLCRDADERERLGQLAAKASNSNRGAAGKVVDAMLEDLAKSRR